MAASPPAHTLTVRELHVEVAGKEILKGVNLELRSGELTAMMGPNGSGKSTLAYALMGHPKYKVTSGEVLLGPMKAVYRAQGPSHEKPRRSRLPLG